jgi:hypothetical protein
VNLGADNAVVAADFDRLFLSQDADGAATALNMGAYALTTSRLILGERSVLRNADINGTGLLTVTGGDIDLYRGTIRAPLASTGTATIDKWGAGLVVLAGDNRGLASTGDTLVAEGTLRLDYTADNNVKIRAASKLNLQGGSLELLGNASAATTQAVGEVTLASGGQSRLLLTPGAGQTLTLAAAAFARASGQGTLRYENAAGASLTTTTVNASHGLLGSSAFATVKTAGVTSFARVDAGAVTSLVSTAANDASAWVAGTHVTDSGSGYAGNSRTMSIGSLRFDAAGGSVLGQTAGSLLTIASGGLLVTERVSAGAPSFAGGFVRSGTNELVVFQDSSRTFEIASTIVSGQTLTIDPTNDLGSGVGYHVLIDSTAIIDNSGGNAFAGISSTAAWNFTTAVNSFSSWISNPAFGLAPADRDLSDDPDGDGVDNGVENFFGTHPGAFTRGLAAGVRNGNSFTFTHPKSASPASDLTASYQWSKDLGSFLAGGATDGAGTTVTFTTQADTPSPGFTTVTATVTGTGSSRLFSRVGVIQN